MDFNKLIEERRSVREYDTDKKVTEEQIKEIVEAAIQAPSWKNAQTARYYCLISNEQIEQFKKQCMPEFNIKNTEGAVLLVSTFVENRSGFDRDGKAENEVGNGWGYYDLGLHNQNLILKAKDIGLDTLITGIRDADKIREFLKIPTEEIIVAVIAVGYGTKKIPKPKRKTTEDILKFY